MLDIKRTYYLVLFKVIFFILGLTKVPFGEDFFGFLKQIQVKGLIIGIRVYSK